MKIGDKSSKKMNTDGVTGFGNLSSHRERSFHEAKGVEILIKENKLLYSTPQNYFKMKLTVFEYWWEKLMKPGRGGNVMLI